MILTRAEAEEFLEARFKPSDRQFLSVNEQLEIVSSSNHFIMIDKMQLVETTDGWIFPLKTSAESLVSINFSRPEKIDYQFLSRHQRALTISSDEVLTNPGEVIKQLDLDLVERLVLDFNFTDLRDISQHVRNVFVFEFVNSLCTGPILGLLQLNNLSRINGWPTIDTPINKAAKIIDRHLTQHGCAKNVDIITLQEELIDAGLDDLAQF